MLILRPEEVEGLLSMAEAVDAVEKAFVDWGKYPEINLTRRRLHFGDARLNTMPGVLPSRNKDRTADSERDSRRQRRGAELSVPQPAGGRDLRHA